MASLVNGRELWAAGPEEAPYPCCRHCQHRRDPRITWHPVRCSRCDADARSARARASWPDIEPEPAPDGGWYRVGRAHVSGDWPVARWRADWAVLGRRGDTLLVRYTGGYVRGIEHGTGWHAEPAIWVSDAVFTTVEIYAQFKPAGHRRTTL